MGHAVNRDEALLHGLEQGRLRLRGGAVDLVGEEERGEDGAFDEVERAILQIKDVCPGDVRGHQIGGELDTGKIGPKDFCEGAHEERFRDAGDALDEDVAAGEDGDEAEVHDPVLSDDDLRYLATGPHHDFVYRLPLFTR